MSDRFDRAAEAATDLAMKATFALKATDDGMSAHDAAYIVATAALEVYAVFEGPEKAAQAAYRIADRLATRGAAA